MVAVLTAFSLYTIVRNRPASNYQAEVSESTVGYDEAEEIEFLERDPDAEQAPGHENIGRSQKRPPRADWHTNFTETSPSQGIHLLDFISQPSGQEKFDFQSCRMTNCFDQSRCNPNESLKVHIVSSPSRSESEMLKMSGEINVIHQNILKVIRESKHFEPNPDKACLFVLEDDTLDRDPLSSSFRPYLLDIFRAQYGFGMNYLIFNLYSGSWPDYKEDDFSGFKIGAAILAKASNSQARHRPEFDISIPLFSYLHPARISSDEAGSELVDSEEMQAKRKAYFLTFKGKRYVVGSGGETRNSLYHLNNERDVIMLTTCKHGKKWRDIKDARCAEEESSYSRYEFMDLMRNSTFCLTPRGRRLGSFRFLEALSCGCIPVILSDGWVWPFSELIDWSEAAIQFPEEDILLVPERLRDIRPQQIVRMRQKCLQLYRKYFSSVEKIVLTTLSIVESRLGNKLSLAQVP